jgi:hypothetical protein
MFIGVFTGPELFVLGKLPTNIGKFMIKVHYAQRPTDTVAPVSLMVLLPGETEEKPSAKIDVDVPAMIRDLPPPNPEIEDPFLRLSAVFQFSALEIKQEGLLKVIALRDDKSYPLGYLSVKTKAPDDVPD